MALAAGYDRSQSMALSHSSADEISSIFPDRPIRPLPKRKLRSRLSSDQAGAINYPPILLSSSPLFGPSQSYNGHTNLGVKANSLDQRVNSRSGHICDCGAEHGSDLDSEEEGGLRLRSYGYESFENTNNKKKRKIPVSAASILMRTDNAQAQMDCLSMETPVSSLPSTPLTQLHPSYSGSGTGFASSGRGRLAKQQLRFGSERRPLGTSSNALNAHVNDHSSRLKRDWDFNTLHHEKDEKYHKDIVSTAAAHAAQRVPTTIQLGGQENMSMLQKQQNNQTRGKAFTFECKSTSSNKMVVSKLPSTTFAMPRSKFSDNGRGLAAQSTQTGPQSAAQATTIMSKHSDRAQAHANRMTSTKQSLKKHRKPEQEYAAAARQRQMQQDISNYHHPPRKEDIWICEFCEYEAIWGKPPVALVRQYEIKDHKERKAAQERRRLLEKAKAKGRKNKKNGRGIKASTSSNATAHREYDTQYDNDALHDHDSQVEEFFDDEYEEDGPIGGSTAQFHDRSYEEDSYISSSPLPGG